MRINPDNAPEKKEEYKTRLQAMSDERMVSEVERNIAPPMRTAITIPVGVDGDTHVGISLYIAQSQFVGNPAAVKTMKAVADRLNVVDVVSLLEIFHDLQADLLEHGREYHHVTPKDLMDRLNKAINYLEQETA